MACPNNGILLSNKVLIHDPSWMNLENIMRSIISQTQKDKWCIVPLIRNMRNKQTHKRQIIDVITRSWSKE